MAWFTFNSNERLYSVTIQSVSKKFGLSQATIVELLANAGYNLFMPFARLSKEHLDVILLAYAQALRSHYKSSIRNFHNFDEVKKREVIEFYKKFIRRSLFDQLSMDFDEGIGIDKEIAFLRTNLDKQLIREYFFDTIRQMELDELMREFHIDYNHDAVIVESSISTPRIHHELRWKISKKHVFSDIKSRISTIIFAGHYYIFTAEEDSITAFLTSLKRCFSAVENTLGEALNYTISKLNSPCTKYKPLLIE
jgi:hypothetical protein